jgi:hypothetical protein
MPSGCCAQPPLPRVCSAVPCRPAARRVPAQMCARAPAPVGRYAGERCTAVARPGLHAHSAGARPTPTRSALQSPDATTQAQRVASRRRESQRTARVRERRPHRRVAWRGNVRPQWNRCGPCLRATHRRPRSPLGPARSARDLRSAPSRASCKQAARARGNRGRIARSPIRSTHASGRRLCGRKAAAVRLRTYVAYACHRAHAAGRLAGPHTESTGKDCVRICTPVVPPIVMHVVMTGFASAAASYQTATCPLLRLHGHVPFALPASLA